MNETFTCPACQRTSHNPNDRAERYCGACHRWFAVGSVVLWSNGLVEVGSPDGEQIPELEGPLWLRQARILELATDASVFEIGVQHRGILPMTREQFAAWRFGPTPDPGLPAPVRGMELFAWAGEDELGSGDVGLKQALCPVGLVPMVSIQRHKVAAAPIRAQLVAQAQHFGTRMWLVRFLPVEAVDAIEPEPPKEAPKP